MIAIGNPAGAETIELAEGVRGRSLWVDARRRLVRNRAAMAGLAVLAVIALMALFAPLLSQYPYDEIDYNVIACAPDWWPAATACTAGGTHWFGTDAAGRDLFVRVLYGATAGYLGGRIDALMMRFVDILYSLPFIFFVIILMVLFDRNFVLLFVAIGAVEWLTMARIVRGQTLAIKQKEFIEAARAAGVSGADIVLRHVIPNVVGPVVVYVTLTVPGVILTESFLSFLGLGIQEPLTSWGVLIFDGSEQMESAPWMLIFPALFMAVTLFCFNFVGDGLRDALDPRDR
jgi:oligopeptide transport system permease protein